MPGQRDDFDAVYRQSANYFGGEPEAILVAHIDAIDRNRPALEAGAGQGRNAFYLAECGIRVDAIDPSAEAVDAMVKVARQKGLPIRALKTGFAEFDPGDGFESYGAVCLFGLVQILDWNSIDVLCERVASWSAEGTLIFMTAFTTEDPMFKSCSKSWREIGKNSFADTEGAVRTFLEPGEAPRLFHGFESVHHWEGLGPEHRHGDGSIQRHGMVEVVLSKRN
jgi:cyclopropane fatty-acyl-phospholipid synthase-like methyltransferase